MITTLNTTSTTFFINKLPLCCSYIFKGQTSYYNISGHMYCTVMRSVHLQVKDRNADFVSASVHDYSYCQLLD